MKGTHEKKAALAKAGRAKIWIRRMLIVAAVLSLVVVATGFAWSTLTSLNSTAWINDDTPEFKGIADYLKSTPTEDAVANVVIVHGISDHCIGYSDTLITNLSEHLTEGSRRSETGAMQAAFKTFDDLNKKGELGSIYPPLEANCNHGSIREYAKSIGVDAAEVMAPYAPGDPNFVVDAQEALCDAINRADSDTARCFKLGVINEDKSVYITGFVRVVSFDGLRFFELSMVPSYALGEGPIGKAQCLQQNCQRRRVQPSPQIIHYKQRDRGRSCLPVRPWSAGEPQPTPDLLSCGSRQLPDAR